MRKLEQFGKTKHTLLNVINFNIKKSKWVKFIRLIGIALFFLVVFSTDLNLVWTTLQKAKPKYIILSLLFQIIMLFLKSYRWHRLVNLKHHNLSFIKHSIIFLESYTIGVFTPGRLGELIKVGHETSRTDRVLAVYKIILERGYDLGFFLLLSAIYLLKNFSNNWLSFIVLFLSLTFLAISFSLMQKNKIIRYISKKFKIDIYKSSQFSLKESFIIFILSALSNFSTFISVYLIALSVNINETFLNISGIVSVTGIINLLPITIMGLGTREYSNLYFLSHYDQNQVFAFSILIFLIIQLVGAIISFLISRILTLNKIF